MPLDHRNNYAVFLNGRYDSEVRGYREALSARHSCLSSYSQSCGKSIGRPSILDTTVVSQCCGCTLYCTATISKEVRR